MCAVIRKRPRITNQVERKLSQKNFHLMKVIEQLLHINWCRLFEIL